MAMVKTPSGWKKVSSGTDVSGYGSGSSGSSGGGSSGALPGYSNPTKKDGSAIDWKAVKKKKSSGGSSAPVQPTQAQTNKVIEDYLSGNISQGDAIGQLRGTEAQAIFAKKQLTQQQIQSQTTPNQYYGFPSNVINNQPVAKPLTVEAYSGVVAPYVNLNWFDKLVNKFKKDKPKEVITPNFGTTYVNPVTGEVDVPAQNKVKTGFEGLQEQEFLNKDVSLPPEVLARNISDKINKDIISELKPAYQKMVDEGTLTPEIATEKFQEEAQALADDRFKEAINNPIFKNKLKQSERFREDYGGIFGATPTEKLKSAGKVIGETAISLTPGVNVVYGARQMVKAQETIKEDGGLFGMNPFQEELEKKASGYMSSAGQMFLSQGMLGVGMATRAGNAVTSARMAELGAKKFTLFGEEIAKQGDTTLIKSKLYKGIPYGESYTEVITPIKAGAKGKFNILTSKGSSQYAVEDFLGTLRNKGTPVYKKGFDTFVTAGKGVSNPALFGEVKIPKVTASTGEGYLVTTEGDKISSFKFGGLTKDSKGFYNVVGGQQTGVYVKELPSIKFNILPSGETYGVPNRVYSGKFPISQAGVVKKLTDKSSQGLFEFSSSSSGQLAGQVSKQTTTPSIGGFGVSIAEKMEQSLSQNLIPSVSAKSYTPSSVLGGVLKTPQEVKMKVQPQNILAPALQPQMVQTPTQEGKAVLIGGLIKPETFSSTRPKQHSILIPSIAQTTRPITKQQTKTSLFVPQVPETKQPYIAVPRGAEPFFGGIPGLGSIKTGGGQRGRPQKTKSSFLPKYNPSLGSILTRQKAKKVTKKEYDILSKKQYSGFEIRSPLQIVDKKIKGKKKSSKKSEGLGLNKFL